MDLINQFINFKTKWRSLIIDVVLLSFWGIVLLKIGDLIRSLTKRFSLEGVSFITDSPELIRVSAFLLYLALLFVVTKRMFEWVRDLRKTNKVYLFRSQDWPNEWIYNGKPELYSALELHIKSSRAGCLLQNYHWKDFKVSFEMRFEPSTFRPMKNIGLVFRAEDLDNYFMLEFFQDNALGMDTNGNPILKSGIKPHIRYKGGWEVMDIEERKFDFSEFRKIRLEVKETTLNLYLENSVVFNWVLPTHVDVMFRESGSQKDLIDEGKSVAKRDAYIYVQEIPFRLGSGMIGFRAHPGQGAVIKALKVEPL